MTSDGNNYATQAADLAKLLEHLKVENPILVGWSTGAMTAWHYVRSQGAGGVRGLVAIDMPPLGMSEDQSDWVEGSIPELAGFFQAIQTPAGHRGVITWYADNVMIEDEMSPEVTAWVVEQSLATPPLIAAHFLADASFSNYLEEAKAVDAEIPSLFVVAEHWSETAQGVSSRSTARGPGVEVFGGHMMFWEYPERFNALLADFVGGTGSPAGP